jgi:diguanylate cyclase (GGDEF)-like protein
MTISIAFKSPLIYRSLQGLILSLGAPLGWLLLELGTGATVSQRLGTYSWVYLYMLIGTAVSYTVFGMYVGANERRLSKLAILDQLTGLYNQRYFSERLHVEFLNAKRAGTCLSLVAIDLDHFKRINDNFGHLSGDKVLQDISREMQHCIREGETLARTGGDEFQLLLPNCNEMDALKTAARIKSAVSKTKTVGSVNVTASIGVATTEQIGEGCEEDLVRLADRKMYKAKKYGRNMVCSEFSAHSINNWLSSK